MLEKRGIAVPSGSIITDISQLKKALKKLPGKEAVIKAQVTTGGRGKLKAVAITKKSEAKKTAKKIFAMRIKGEKPKELLIEEKIDIKKEHYLACTIDRSRKELMILYSERGGIDIEDIASENPHRIIKAEVCPAQRKILPKEAKKLPKNIRDISAKLIASAYDNEATLIEINPLAETRKGLIAADAKIIIDDSAIYRHPEISSIREKRKTQLEERAHKKNMQYVELEGNIAVIGNGAGLVMATIDMIETLGGKAANFLDVGGGSSAKEMKEAMSIVLSKKEVKGLIINIFGGITHCDEIAKGIVEFKKKNRLNIPIAVRMIGTNEQEAKKTLERSGINTEEDMETTAKKIIKLINTRKRTIKLTKTKKEQST